MSHGEDPGFRVHQEEDVVAERTLRRVGALVVAVSVLSVGVAAWVLGEDGGRGAGHPAERARTEGMVAPQTLGLVEQTLIEHTATGVDEVGAAEARLHRFGWVDRARGIAHVPIDLAMDLVVAENQRDAGVAEGGAR